MSNASSTVRAMGPRTTIGSLFCAGMCIVVMGCAGTSPRQQATGWPFLGLHEGMALQDVQRVLGERGTHQFTATREDSQYLCLSFKVEQLASSYYFVFERDRLTKVVEPLLAEDFRDVKLDGSTVSVRMPFDPLDKIEKVLSRPSLGDTEVSEAVVRARTTKPAFSFNQTPAAVLTLPALALEAPRIAADYKRNRELAAHYDAFLAPLGAQSATIDGLYGRSYASHAAASREMRVYGEAVTLDINPAHRFSWVAVIFAADRAIAVISHDFFHAEFLNEAPPGWR